MSTGSCNLIISIEKLQCCHAGAHRRARPDRRPGHEPALPACPDVHVDAPAVVATAITAGRPTSRSRTWAGRAARARRPIRTAHPPRLPLPDHVHGLVSLGRSPRRVECPKALLRHCHLGEGSALLPREIDVPDRSQQAHVTASHSTNARVRSRRWCADRRRCRLTRKRGCTIPCTDANRWS